MLFLFTSLGLSAQKVGLRAEFGLQSLPQQSTYLIGSNKSVDFKISTVSVTPATSVGLYTQFDYGWMFFQPEFLYTTYSQTLSVENFSEEAGTRPDNLYTDEYQQFDIPVYAGVKIKRVKIGVGPVFHVGRNINTELTQFEKLEIKPSTVSAGVQAGVGVDLKYFNLDIKYQRDFNQATEHIYFNESNRQLNSSLSSLRVGIAFALGKK